MIAYRTKTYVAGEWSGDSDAIEQLYNGMKEIGGVFISMMRMHTNNVMILLNRVLSRIVYVTE